jgi:hypothetical protein
LRGYCWADAGSRLDENTLSDDATLSFKALNTSTVELRQERIMGSLGGLFPIYGILFILNIIIKLLTGQPILPAETPV